MTPDTAAGKARDLRNALARRGILRYQLDGALDEAGYELVPAEARREPLVLLRALMEATQYIKPSWGTDAEWVRFYNALREARAALPEQEVEGV